MAWATADDVTDAWIGDDAPEDDEKLEIWLEKAEREIKFRIPDLLERIADQAALDPPSTDLVDLAKDVEIAMVTRVFRNPENLRQTTVTTGPFSESRTVGGDTPGSLELTDGEVKKLTGRRGGAFTIDLDSRRRHT